MLRFAASHPYHRQPHHAAHAISSDPIELHELLDLLLDGVLLAEPLGDARSCQEADDEINNLKDIELVVLHEILDLLCGLELAQVEIFDLRVVLLVELKKPLQLLVVVLDELK